MNANEAKTILAALGLPAKQQNDLSALTLLALAELKPSSQWSQAQANLHRINDLLNFMEQWRARYAENTRETVRKEVLKPLVEAHVLEKNPDDPSRPINSPNTRYRLTKEALAAARAFGTPDFDNKIKQFLNMHGSLAVKFRKERGSSQISVAIPGGRFSELSPGTHSEIERSVVEKFLPTFARNAELVYLGDTANKKRLVNILALKQLKIGLDDHGKLPDIILWDKENNWLYLIEAVATSGPVTPLREAELRKLFAPSFCALVLVSAFADRREFRKHAASIAWETEVWLADEPKHLIHYNGEKFLGPY